MGDFRGGPAAPWINAMTLAKVAVIDDHDVVREGITSHLAAKLPHVQVVASVATVAELAGDL